MKKPTDIPSKRRSGRHDESATRRYRELKLYRRIDRHGNPLDYTPQEIAEMMARHEHNAPPRLFPNRDNPIPDNVTSITKNQKPTVTSASGNEAESLEDHGYKLRYGPLAEDMKAKDKAAKGEVIKRNHNPGLSDEPVVMSNPGPTVVEGNKKLRGLDPSSETKPLPLATKFYMPPRPGSTLAPSGLPMSAFLEGGKYSPPETAVVYTTTSPPPTPTRDWRSDKDYAAAMRDGTQDEYWRSRAANDSYNPAEQWAKTRIGFVQWFINHVEPQNWHATVYEYVRWTNDGPVVNTGAINKAAAKLDEENKLLKAMNNSHEREWRMLDGALTDAHSEINILRQELQARQAELKNLEFVHAHSIGDYESAQQIAEELLSMYTDVSKSKSPPEDADKLLSEYNLHNSFVRVDGPEFAFARLAYGDPRLGQVIRDHADMRFQERFGNNKNISKFFYDLSGTIRIMLDHQAEYEQQKYDDYVNFWQEKYPVYLKQRARRSMSTVRDPAREAVSLAAMARKAKPALHKPSSTYYSSFHSISGSVTEHLWRSEKGYGYATQSVAVYEGLPPRDRNVNSAVAKAITSKIKPCKVRHNNPALVDGDDRESWAQPPLKTNGPEWWAKRLDWLELRDAVASQPIKVAMVKSYNKTVDLLNTELNPLARAKKKRLVEERRRMNADIEREHNERKEQRKEEKLKAKQQKAERDHIRKMQRLAH